MANALSFWATLLILALLIAAMPFLSIANNNVILTKIQNLTRFTNYFLIRFLFILPNINWHMYDLSVVTRKQALDLSFNHSRPTH